MMNFRFLILLIFFPLFVFSDNLHLITDVVSHGIKVDLREPKFEDGVLSSDEGGVIEGKEIRIQAKKIKYTKKKSLEHSVVKIEAEGDLIVEYNQYIFVGHKLEYDFITRSGVLYQARSALQPWFFGGDTIYLNPDGSYEIKNAFVTTSENYDADWKILAEEATISDQHLLKAKNVQFTALRMPLLKLPFFNMNLGSIFDQPIRYEARAGTQGPRISAAYEIFSWNRFKTFLRFDYRLQRGLGGGFENYYQSIDKLEKFESINFIARDAKSYGNHDVTIRYRFQGIYRREIPEKKMTIDFTYDKLSDKEMATDYKERGLNTETAGRTELIARKETDFWITNFLTRARINGFQTTKQELPTFETHIIPFNLKNTGIISENQFKLSYLDFRYANSIKNAHDYKSTRFSLSNRFYRPTKIHQITVTPEIGSLMIYEGNSPEGGPSFVGLGIFNCELETRMHRFYSRTKHVIRPFVRYEYYTFPTSSPKKHYIFDIDDGWYKLNFVRIGMSQNFYYKDENDLINRYLEADLWTNAFINCDTIPATFPKVYSKLIFNSFYTLKHTCSAAYDFEESRIDHFNLRTDWTVSSDFAIAAEYRHRSSYDFRKADPYNFFVDAYHSLKELRKSQMSDRRDTLLLHFFYRANPNWALEFESRHGWNRHFEPNYNEFQADLYGTLWSCWNLKLSYQHLEDDDRFIFAVSLGTKPPDREKYNSFVPKLQF